MALSILLVGSTGNIGTMIAQELLRRKIELRRIAFYARPGASSEKEVLYAMAEALGMERVEGEIFDIAIYRGFDIVICCLSHDSILDQISIIDTAVAGGVRHIIPSEFGGDLSCGAFYEKKALLWRYKLLVQAHLERVVREEPEFGYTLVYVGIFTELMIGQMMCNIMGLDTAAFTGEVFGRPGNIVWATSANDVAAVTVAALVRLNPSNFAGKQEVFVYGQKLSLAEAYGIFEKVCGRPFTVRYRSAEECERQLDKFVQAGTISQALYMSLCHVCGFCAIMPEGKKMTFLHGIELEDFEATVRRTIRPVLKNAK